LDSNKVKYIPVDFDPFSNQARIATTEPQREILANVFLGGHDANCSYNESVSLHLRGKFDVKVFKKCIPFLLDRHEALGATFTEDGLWQQFNAVNHHDVTVHDLETFREKEKAEFISKALACEAEEAFDLHHGPLYRFVVIRHTPEYHQLILSFHHIICDGWSLGIIMQDLGKIYSALINNKSYSDTPALKFTDYTKQEELYEKTDECGKVEEFWLNQYKNNLPSFEFPADKPRPALRTYNARRIDVEVDTNLVASLRKMGASYGVSYVTMLTAAFELYLHRATQLDDIVVALPAAGQSATGHHALVGHCVNVLPLRSKVSSPVTFSQYVKQRKSELLDAYDHQRFTFGSLVRKLNIPRDPSRIPLVPVAFNLDLGITDGVQFDGCTLEFSTNPRHYENFEIFINAAGQGNKLILECTHNTDLFDSALMQLRMEGFIVFLQSALIRPDVPVADLDILTSIEKDLIFNRYNRIDADFQTPLTIDQWFDNTAQKFPSRIAVTSGGEHITYADLNSRSNRLASYLRNLGCTEGTLIGLLTNRNIDLIVSMLGILKAGGVYVPIDPGYPNERIAHILSDSGCKHIILSKQLVKLVPGTVSEQIIIDGDWESAGNLTDKTVPCNTRPDHLSYIIYTSGSTGKPKGSLIEHRNVTRLFTATESWYHFNETDVWTMFHSAAFDFSVWEIWGALLYGGRLVIVPFDISRDPELFYELLVNEKVTVLNQTPSAFRTLIYADGNRKTDEKHISSLRYVIFGGEALELESLRPWFDRHSDQKPRLINMYGITETTVHVTYRPVYLKDLDESKGSMIGVPIPDLQVYILDNYRQPVPVGIPGEMYVGGAGVGRGYLNRPDLTSYRFLFNEFNPFAETPLYRSGDLARMTLNGDLEYLGRIDNQVKIRGFRIELGEIESVIEKHAGVRQQVVIVREDTPGDKRLVAYVVMAEGYKLDLQEMRNYLKSQLPEYMIPASFVAMESIPVTSNGKTDRKALPQPEQDLHMNGSFSEPASPLEELLSHIWCDVLGVYRVGRNDNFFELGGHSILGVKMLNDIDRKLGVKMNLPILFTSPTIAELAEVINKEGPTKPVSCLVTLQPKGNNPPLFCIHMHNGNVNRWRVLVKHLGDDQPVYAVQPLGLDPNQQPHTTIEQMANHYLKVIREVQPHGPYHLIGLCFSGMVVFEMAALLEAAGEKVAYLGMINNYAPPENPKLYRLKKGINKFMRMEMGEKFNYAMEKNIELGKKLFGSGKKKGSIVGDELPDFEFGNISEEGIGNDLRGIHSLALLNYHPVHVIPSGLFIYRTSDPIEDNYNEHLGWDRLIKGVIHTTVISGCDNDTIITDEPYNVTLSTRIKEHLEIVRKA
jgi:amino acid adenylation domain-containing protein